MSPEVRFLYVGKTKSEIEQMYKNKDTIQYGDFVFQKVSDDTGKIFMNGQWVKSMYNSKISDNVEIEDDINLLSSSINDVSNRLSDKYVTIETYIQDEQLIASTLATYDNKINNFSISNSDVSNIKTSLETLTTKTENLENKLDNLNNIIGNDSTDNINNVIDTYKEVENFLSNISDSSTLTDMLMSLENNIINSDNLTNYYTKNIIDNISANLNDVSVKQNDLSTNLNDVSIRLDETNDKLQNYVTIEELTENENLVASTFADIQNKIEPLQNTVTELNNKITELQEQIQELQNKTSN